MITLDSLLENITLAIDDTSFSEDQLISLVNRAILLCAGEVLLSSLESTGSFTTDILTNTILIPEDWNFHRELFYAQDVTILNSKSLLVKLEPQYESNPRTGPVEYVVQTGSTLFYYPNPEEPITIPCGFHKRPTTLVLGSDNLTELPISLAEEIIENFVLFKLWSTIEDGVEGRQVNTVKFKKLFLETLELLETQTTTGQSRRQITRNTNWT